LCLYLYIMCFSFVFFQAEDGIRYRNVTGVQTCALPIWIILYCTECSFLCTGKAWRIKNHKIKQQLFPLCIPEIIKYIHDDNILRSEERRVGKDYSSIC